MSIVEPAPLEPMIGDPDDHRPKTHWRLVVDPGDASGRVDSLCLLIEHVAVGDRIPLHTHPVDELIAIVGGDGDVRLGEHHQRVSAGWATFVPAGTPHGTANIGDRPLELHAIFPGTEIEIAMLERNPAPGTEGDRPRRSRLDLRTGEVRVLE